MTSSGSDELCKVVTVLKTCMYCHPEACNATYLKEIIKHFFFLAGAVSEAVKGESR